MRRPSSLQGAVLAILCALAWSVMSGPVLAAQVPTFQVIDLGFEAVAINDQGWVVGNDTTGAVLWRPGAETIHIGPGTARDINSFGRVVGDDWIWDPIFGFVQPSGLIGATAINDLGQVAGFSAVMNGYLWDPLFGFMSLNEPVPGMLEFHPLDLNNQGLIVGWGGSAEPITAYWLPGFEQAKQLPATAPNNPYAGFAYGANAVGQIVGTNVCTAPGPGDCDVAYIWNSFGEPAREIALGRALDINDLGWVVGGDFSTEQGLGFSFLWSEDFGLQDLNDLIRYSGGEALIPTLVAGTDLNNAGSIIADHRYLLTQSNRVAEPSTLAITLLSAVIAIRMGGKARSTRKSRGLSHDRG